MTKFWEYEPTINYFRREREQFEREARIKASNTILQGELSNRGYDPGTYQFTPTVFDFPKVTRATGRGSGGVLGKIGSVFDRATDLVGDATETVFRGPLDQPWDVFRSLKQGLDWEAENIGKPLYNLYISGTPEESILRKSIPEAIGSAAFSPSTWLGPGAVKLGFKGVKTSTGLVTNSRLLTPLFGPRLPQIMGAAGESPTLQKMLEASANLPSSARRLKSTQEVLTDAAANKRLSSGIKAMLAKSPAGRWISEHRPTFFESDISILNHERGSLASYFDNLGSAYYDTVGATFRKGYKLEAVKGAKNQFKITNVIPKNKNIPAQPNFGDFIANHKNYKLNGIQQAFIKEHDEAFGLMGEYEKVAGVGTDIRVYLNGSYGHRQALTKLVNLRDPASLEMYEKFVETGPLIRGRFGAKQAFERPLKIVSQAQGEALGIEYMHPIDAQVLRIRQGGVRIADEWFKAALEPVLKTPRQLMPSELTETLTRLSQEQAGLKRVAAAIKSAGVNGKFVRPRNLTGPADEMATRIAKRTSEIVSPGTRQQYLLRELKEVNTFTKTIQAATKGPARQWKAQMKKVRLGGTTEFPTQVPALGNRFADYGAGRKLNELLRPKSHGSIEQAIIAVNNFFRPIMATIDVSPLGVQGRIALSRNPKAYFRAIQYAFTEGYDDVMRNFKETGLLDEYLQFGGHLAGRHDAGEYLFRGLGTKIPGAKWSNAWFVKFNNSLRTLMYKSGRDNVMRQVGKGATTREKGLTELTEAVGKATGYVPGDISTVEQLGEFAPRFFRAQLGSVADAFTRGDIAGQEARQNLSRLILSSAALVYGVNKASGEETEFDPTHPNFLRIRALGRDISVLGPWDTLARGMAMYYDKGPVEASKYIARSKASPVVSQAWNIVVGENFRGEQMDFSSTENMLYSIGRIGKSLGPISIQQAAEGGVPTNLQEVLGAGLEFTGGKSTPLSAFEKLTIERERRAGELYGKDWDDLEPSQRRNLEQAFPKLTDRPEAFTSIGKAFEARRTIIELYDQQQAALDSSFPPGYEWVEAYRDLNQRKAGALFQWEQQNLEAVQSQNRDLNSDNPDERARAQYYASFDQARTSYGDLDVEKLSNILNALETSWTPSQKGYVERNTGLSNSPRVREWRAAQKVLQPYWEITDQVWGLLREQPEYATYSSLDEYIRAKAEELRRAGLPEDIVQLRISKLPIASQVERAVNDLRRRLRTIEPSIDALLVKWYGLTPIAAQGKSSSRETVLTTSLGLSSRRGRVGALSSRG
jgi:hypothetical protein